MGRLHAWRTSRAETAPDMVPYRASARAHRVLSVPGSPRDAKPQAPPALRGGTTHSRDSRRTANERPSGGCFVRLANQEGRNRGAESPGAGPQIEKPPRIGTHLAMRPI